jgi:replication factor A2
MDYQGDQSGGFNNSGGGLTPNASQGGASSKAPRKAYDEQTLIAVTCKMILQASSTSSQDGTGALALPDGRTLHHVKLVGAVRSVENLSTNISYDIEDGTGLVTVKQWMDDNDSSALQEEKEAAAKDAQYLKIVGQIKDYDGKKSLVAHSIRKINSGDEITHHMLEVVYSAEKYQRAERIGGAAAPVSMQQHHQMNSPLQQQQQQQSGGDDGLKDQVLNYIKVEGEKLEVGAAVPKLVQMLTGKFTESQVRASIEDLASEGHIYSTINEDQYKFAM